MLYFVVLCFAVLYGVVVCFVVWCGVALCSKIESDVKKHTDLLFSAGK